MQLFKPTLFFLSKFSQENRDFSMISFFSFMAKFLILANIFLSPVQNFPPARLISDGLNLFKDHLDEVNKTFSHEEILERGLVKSVAKYFAKKQNNTLNNSVGLDDVIDLKRLFSDYKNEVYCQIGLEKVLREKLQPAVILVDVKQRTSKLPHAHFDAETFRESNQRVINFTNQIVDLIMNGYCALISYNALIFVNVN